jgi:hypothetical protein
MTDPNGIASEGFTGHKPQPDGRCEHRWRNRQTKIVTCRFADGWHAGRVTLAPALAALTKIQHDAFDYNDECRYCGADIEDDHDDRCPYGIASDALEFDLPKATGA